MGMSWPAVGVRGNEEPAAVRVNCDVIYFNQANTEQKSTY